MSLLNPTLVQIERSQADRGHSGTDNSFVISPMTRMNGKPPGHTDVQIFAEQYHQICNSQ